MRLATACLMAALLVSCSQQSQPPASPVPTAPAGAGQLSGVYGSYADNSGDIVVIARLGWFFDMRTSAYRTIYVATPPSHFYIGCRFREPTPKCADLIFAGDRLQVTNSAHQTSAFSRIQQSHTDAAISSSGATLAATITEPAGQLRGGIVIVHGAEPGERYFYDVWVGIYTSLGLAVLTYDKRGIGQSTGRYPGEFPTVEALQTYADDATAALDFLKGLLGVGARAGFHGGSQGGWTVPLALLRHGRGAFAVLVSAPATTVDQTDLWAGFTNGGGTAPSQSDAQMLDAVRATHSGYDPASALRALAVPTLWVLGTHDRTVPTAVCLEILTALNKPNIRVKEVPTGHGLLVNATGLLADDDRSVGLAPQLVPTLRDWLESLS